MKPKILNASKVGLCVPDSAYVGRFGSIYGNHFYIGKDGSRTEVIRKFASWVWAPEQRWIRDQARRELMGKNLICWCAPKKCHAEIWLKVLEGKE